MALKLLLSKDSMTRPRSVQEPEAPVLLVARKIAEREVPKLEAE